MGAWRSVKWKINGMCLAQGREDLGGGHDTMFKYLQGCQVEEKGGLFCVLQKTEIGFHGKQIFPASEKGITFK